MLALTSLFTALTVVGAQLRVPLPLVPLSLQDFFAALAGLVLGPKYGALSQVLYLILGLAGLPVFTKGGGPAYVLQPTFGYLLGFPLASYIVGRLVHRKGRAEFLPRATWLQLWLAGALGVLALLTLGVLYLWLNTNWIVGQELKLAHAVYLGAIVFLPAQAIKIAAVSLLYRALLARVRVKLANAPRNADCRSAS